MRSNIYIHYINKEKEMNLRMHNNDFDILLGTVLYSAKLQISKLYQNAQKFKFYLDNGSWKFEFSYKIYLAQNLQRCLVPLAAWIHIHIVQREWGTGSQCLTNLKLSKSRDHKKGILHYLSGTVWKSEQALQNHVK